MKYTFIQSSECNMCGSETSSHKRLGKRLNVSQGKNPSKKTGIATTIMQCTNCGLIYPQPLPIPVNIQDHYGIPPENYWKPEYFEFNEGYFKNVIDKVNELRPITKGQKCLDIGAGLGKAMKALENSGFEAYGIEPSEPFYSRALDLMKIDPTRLSMKAIEEAEYPEENFDFITFGAVLEHLYDPNASIQKALKWLKPGGLIHIEVPSSDWLTHKIINFYYKLRRMDYVANLSPMHEPFHLYEFRLDSFLKNGLKNGYHVPYQEYYVCETFLPKFLDPILVPYMKRSKKGMQLCVYLQKNDA